MNLFNFPNDIIFELIKAYLPSTVEGYVDRLKDVPQGYDWHPEGNVLVHTKVVLNRSLAHKDTDITLAAFFHDLGKVDVTKPNGRGGYSAHKHELVSCDLVKYSRKTIKTFNGNPDLVHWLVENHMRVKHIDEMKAKKRKDLTDHGWFPLLDRFKDCDHMGDLTALEVVKARGSPLMFWFNKMKFKLKKTK